MNGNVKKKSKKKKELTVRSGNLVSEVNNDKGGGGKNEISILNKCSTAFSHSDLGNRRREDGSKC